MRKTKMSFKQIYKLTKRFFEKIENIKKRKISKKAWKEKMQDRILSLFQKSKKFF
jgi:hypothetical protein